MEWYEIVIEILSGLIIMIPLVVKLVEYVKAAAIEKNWDAMLQLVMNLMKEAEGKFDNGAARKEWVLMAVKASADTINYPIDMDKVSKLIDNLCAMSKVVNMPKIEEVVDAVEKIEE
jgi:hypothetical protein